MTDETRAELRDWLAGMVRMVSAGAKIERRGDGGRSLDCPGHLMLPPLTPAQHLALSVLLGDGAVIPQALADYMIDAGHEYATACYERGKRDGNPCAAYSESMAAGAEAYATMLQSLTPLTLTLTPMPFPEDDT